MSIVYVHYDVATKDGVQKFQTGPFGTLGAADVEIEAVKKDGAVNAKATHLDYDDRTKVAPKAGKLLKKAA